MKRFIKLILMILCLCMALSACGAVVQQPTLPPTSTPTQATIPESTATLYIGTKVSGFSEYPLTYQGELTPEVLISGIESLTGWNLTLADIVTTGKGGMTVCFSQEAALFTGPPEPQKEEFFVYDGVELAHMILDSIQKTLQMGFTILPMGNPDLLDIYYAAEDDRPLLLPDAGLSWPLEQPYQWENHIQQPCIPFEDGQYYAVAYLGYENMDALTAYSQEYLGGAEVPVLQISGGEYYLVIPRYEGMELEIYANELEPQQSTLFYESENATPFVLQCNISDIFPNSTIRFSYEGMNIEFSPYQSLMDGSLQIGTCGVDITVYE